MIVPSLQHAIGCPKHYVCIKIMSRHVYAQNICTEHLTLYVGVMHNAVRGKSVPTTESELTSMSAAGH